MELSDCNVHQRNCIVGGVGDHYIPVPVVMCRGQRGDGCREINMTAGSRPFRT